MKIRKRTMGNKENTLQGTLYIVCNMVRNSCILVSILLLLFLLLPLASASNTTLITNSQGGLYFTGTASDPMTFYQDAIGNNIDVGLRLCGFGQRYVGGFYAINVSGTKYYSLVTYQSSSEALSYTDTPIGGGCDDVTPGFLTISPSQLATPDPQVNKAAFPGQLWTGYAVTSNPAANISGFEIGGNDSLLRGNYSAARSFNYATRQITIQTPQIMFESLSANFSKSANDSQFGLSSDRQMVAGICKDTDGADCSDGGLYSNSAVFPLALNTDLAAPQVSDQQTYTRYTVFNGIGLPMCIGANLKMTIDSITPAPSYFSQNLTISTTITNALDSPFELQGGNVPVTTAFNINLWIYNGTNVSTVNQSYPVALTILPGQSIQYNITYPAFAHSGVYTIFATIDSDNVIAECNESDNTATANYSLYPVTVPNIQIDGVNGTVFPYPNIPYLVNVSIYNSDNDSIPNATLQFVEVNGLNLNIGTQEFNISSNSSNFTKSGVVGTSIAQFMTDYLGFASLTYIPTYNQLYEPQYGYLELSNYIGNSQRYMIGSLPNGTQFIFIVNNSVTTQFPFYVANLTYNVSVTQKNVYNNVTMAQAFDNIYRTFTNFVLSLIG